MENITAKLIINSTQIPNYLIDDVMRTISPVSFEILMIIARQTYGWASNTKTGERKDRDWIAYSQLMEKTGKQRQAVSQALRELRSKYLIQVFDEQGNELFSKEDCLGKKLFYRINTTSLIIKQVTPNQYENQTLKIKHTKETNTKTLSKDNGRVGKKPTCPLLNGSPLKSKYPNGHTECEEYVDSEEKDRGLKFINRPKQYAVIHKILRAGYGFDVMDKTIRQVEKKYGKGAWDYATLASWIEKGSANA